ncbi:hypothetical protein [Nonomuraea diastatica]|uniref:hypothetical protein n=1 Tax=Nonomuraea diastatica TaxID=1848329 RepID=UPI00140C1E1B|nr:hypothetical protein [Nonomuraea diastatica]
MSSARKRAAIMSLAKETVRHDLLAADPMDRIDGEGQVSASVTAVDVESWW